MICLSNGSSFELQAAIVQERPIKGLFVGRFFPIFPICRTFLGDFTPDRLDSRSLETLWGTPEAPGGEGLESCEDRESSR